MHDTGVYLYAVTRPVDPELLKDIEGVSGAAVRVLDHDDLSAVVSTVPLDEFGERALRANVEELDWLAATARAHHDVVERAARTVPAAPARLATVFHGDDRVHHLLEKRHDAFTDALQLIAGRDEWAIKIFEGARVRDDEREPEAPSDPARPAAAYLARRKAQRTKREDRARRMSERADIVHRSLIELAVASRSYPPQDAKLSGRSAPMIINMAYLVDNFRSAEFGAAADDIAREQSDLDMDVSGPWPPYSFIEMEET